MKFAIWILVILAVVSVISMFIVQFYPIDKYVQNWEELYSERYAPFFPIMKYLELHDPYRAWWYQVLLGILSLSLVFCIIDNAPKAVKNTFRTKFINRPDEIKNYSLNAEFESGDKFIENISRYLTGFHVTKNETTDKILISANRSRVGYLGPVLTHVGLLLLVVGGLLAVRGITTFEGGYPGDIIEDENLDFQVRVDDFNIEYYPLGVGQWVLVDDHMIGKTIKKLSDGSFRVKFFSKGSYFYKDVEADRLRNKFDSNTDRGNISDYISTLTVIKDDREILTQKVEVNKPLRYGGFRFYQNSFNSRSPRIISTIDSAVVEIKITGMEAAGDTVLMIYGEDYILPDENIARMEKFVPHFMMSEKGIISASENLVNPAVEIAVYSAESESEELYHQWCFIGKDFHGAAKQAAYRFNVLEVFNPVSDAKYMTILEIKGSQGYLVIWIGLIICTIGIIAIFYLSPKHIWFTYDKKDPENKLYVAGYSARGGSLFNDEFNKLVNKIKGINN